MNTGRVYLFSKKKKSVWWASRHIDQLLTDLISQAAETSLRSTNTDVRHAYRDVMEHCGMSKYKQEMKPSVWSLSFSRSLSPSLRCSLQIISVPSPCSYPIPPGVGESVFIALYILIIIIIIIIPSYKALTQCNSGKAKDLIAGFTKQKELLHEKRLYRTTECLRTKPDIWHGFYLSRKIWILLQGNANSEEKKKKKH